MADFYDTDFLLRNSSDGSKTAIFDLSNLTSGFNYFQFPPTPTTLAGTTIAQTFTDINIFEEAPEINRSAYSDYYLVFYNTTDDDVVRVTFSGALAGGTLTFPVNGTIALTSDIPTVDSARTWSSGLQKFYDTKIQVVDDGDTTKAWQWQLSGATTGKVLTESAAHTADRTHTRLDSTGSIPLDVNSAGTSARDKTGQTGSISTTTVHTTTHAGFYLVKIYMVCTAFTSAGQIQATVTWTDPYGAKTTVLGTLDVGVVGDDTHQYGPTEILVYGTDCSAELYCTNGTNIRYAVTKASGTFTYSSYVRVIDLG